ncbi:MAG: DUF393 domain-containing protein [bacterium]
MNRPVLIYDGACGFCTSSARWMRSLVGRERLRIQPYQTSEDLEQWGLSSGRASKAVWLAMHDGILYGGAEAVNTALALRWWGRPFLWLYRLPLVGRTEDAVYRWMARNRGRLPGGPAET